MAQRSLPHRADGFDLHVSTYAPLRVSSMKNREQDDRKQRGDTQRTLLSIKPLFKFSSSSELLFFSLPSPSHD